MAWTPPATDEIVAPVAPAWTPPEGDLHDAPAPVDHAANLGKALYEAIHHAVNSASPFRAGPITQAATTLGQSGAPGVVAGMTGTELPPDASIPAQIMRQVADPAVAGNLAAAAVTGGASLPIQAGMAALATGAGRALQEGNRQAMTGEDSTGKVLGEGTKAGLVAGALQVALSPIKTADTLREALGYSGKTMDTLKPALTKMGAQLIRVVSAVPEKYGKAVLENPAILSLAPTLLGAKKIYQEAVGGLGGLNDFLQGKSGKLIASTPDVTKILNDGFAKIADKSLSLEEALAARQAASNLLQLAKFGNPEQMANKRALILAKSALDEYLETGLPGFKAANRGYFEANAREAFGSWLPQNRNMSPNVLRGLGMLSQLSASALMEAPALLLTAGASSPKLIGYAIRAGSAAAGPSAMAVKFAARVTATRATEQ